MNMDDVFGKIDLDATVEKFGEVKSGLSRVLVTCPVCLMQRETSFRCVRGSIKKFGDCLCSKCRAASAEIRVNKSRNTKKLWDDPNYRTSVVNGVRETWNDERRNSQSNIAKELWNNDEYRDKIVCMSLKLHQEKTYSDKFASAMQRLWGSKQHVDKIREMNKSLWDEEKRCEQSSLMVDKWKSGFGSYLRGILSSDDSKEHKKEVAHVLWSNLEYRRRQSDAVKQLWRNQTYRNKITEAARRQWENVEFRNKFAATCSNFLLSGKRSKPEIITKKLLDVMGIDSIEQKNIGPYIFDFYIPSFDMFIEVQGEYWHSSPDVQRKDTAKFSYLERAFPHAKILYLYERDFLNPSIIKQKLMDGIYGDNVEQILTDFSFNDIRIDTAGIDESRDFLNSFHYAQFGRTAKIIFGAYLDNKIIAVCKFSTPIRKEVATSISKKFSEVLELDRMCIHPKRHKKNFASWFISKCSKMTFDLFNKVTTLVSFADLTYGHIGSIYKSSNWKQVGIVKPDYYYVNEDGWMMHKKTLYSHAMKMGKKEREYAEEFRYTRIMGKEKIKFVFECKV